MGCLIVDEDRLYNANHAVLGDMTKGCEMKEGKREEKRRRKRECCCSCKERKRRRKRERERECIKERRIEEGLKGEKDMIKKTDQRDQRGQKGQRG